MQQLQSSDIHQYVWHVSHSANDFSVALKGILPINDYVYVNNHSHSLKKMWPIPIDSWDYMDITEEEYLTYYTFWRIDTLQINCEWEIDERMTDEISMYNLLDAKNYIKTIHAIPPSAILPFKYAQGQQESIQVEYSNGAASIEDLTNGLPLILDHGLVNWIAWRKENGL